MVANEITAAEWFKTEIHNWIFSTVKIKMGHLILNTVLTDELSCFDTKQQFLNRILIDIGESGNFREYIDYLTYDTKYFIQKIREYVLAILDKSDPLDTKKTKLAQLIDNELLMYASKVKSSLEELLRMKTFVDSSDYFMKLKTKIGTKSETKRFDYELLSLANSLTVIERMEITDFERFTQLLIENILSIQRSITDLSYNGNSATYTRELYSVLRFPFGTDPVDVLLERVLGCKERCPFCRTPCKYTCERHAGDHNALQHCPVGVLGSYQENTKQLFTWNCQSAVASDLLFIFPKTDGLLEPFKEYRKYFPNWEILPDRRMESSLYWKWFMNTFHDSLVQHYNVEHADIPKEWKEIQWEDAKQSLSKIN